MSKRILLISDIDNIYTKRYIERVLHPDGWEIFLYPIWEQTSKFTGWFLDHNVTIYRDTHRLPVIRHIPRLRMWVRVFINAQALKKLGPFDAIHNHYLSQRDLALGREMKQCFPDACWICSFWGSDLLRARPRDLKKMASPLKTCDKITVISPLHIEMIQEIFGDCCAKKTVVCDFGVDLYDDIDRLRLTTSKAECKAHFGLLPDQPLICLGYNASAPQRHLEMLHALVTLPQDVLSEWSVILQMTYGNTDESYFDSIREAASQLTCRSLILTEFMNDEESAYLRLAADAFVLAMPTDAFSSSIQEYLYAGAHVLCADWLVYSQLEELDIRLIRFHNISEFPVLLADALQNPVLKDEMGKRQTLRDRYSWNALLEDWTVLYHRA